MGDSWKIAISLEVALAYAASLATEVASWNLIVIGDWLKCRASWLFGHPLKELVYLRLLRPLLQSGRQRVRVFSRLFHQVLQQLSWVHDSTMRD